MRLRSGFNSEIFVTFTLLMSHAVSIALLFRVLHLVAMGHCSTSLELKSRRILYVVCLDNQPIVSVKLTLSLTAAGLDLLSSSGPAVIWGAVVVCVYTYIHI